MYLCTQILSIMKKLFTLFTVLTCFAFSTISRADTTVTWDEAVMKDHSLMSGESYTYGGITLSVIRGSFESDATSRWVMPEDPFYGANLSSYEEDGVIFSCSTGYVITRIEVTCAWANLAADGWTLKSDGAVWTGYDSDVTMSSYLQQITQIVFTIEEGFENFNVSANPDPQKEDVYYSTFYHSIFAYELPVGVEAYIATIDDDALYLTKIAGGGQTIPTANAVILKSTIQNYTLTSSDASPVSVGNNNLQGVDVNTEVSDLGISCTCYVLSGHSTDNSVTGVGFYQYTGELKAHRAYVVVGNAAPKRMRFVFDTETDIERVEQPYMAAKKYIENGMLIIEKNGVRYNVQGQIIK